jgi:hypothetical protein
VTVGVRSIADVVDCGNDGARSRGTMAAARIALNKATRYAHRGSERWREAAEAEQGDSSPSKADRMVATRASVSRWLRLVMGRFETRVKRVCLRSRPLGCRKLYWSGIVPRPILAGDVILAAETPPIPANLRCYIFIIRTVVNHG